MTANGDVSEDQLLDGVVLKLPPIPIEILDITFSNEPVTNERTRSVDEKCILPFASSSLANVNVEDARILASGDDVKTIIELSLNNTEAALDFKVGDSIGILPQNDENEVNLLLHRLKLSDQSDVECSISLKEVNTKKKVTIPNHLPQNETLKYIFKYCIEIRSVLKKIFICALSTYTTDPTERRRLEEISSREGSSIYNQHILEKHVSILDILNIYTTCQPPVTLLMQHLPRLMPRPYSVCNSPLVDKHTIKVCFSVLAINNEKKGIATGWMEKITRNILQSKEKCLKYDIPSELESINQKILDLNINNDEKCKDYKIIQTSIPIYLRKSTNFTLPSDLNTPIIMVGPGTGVAPFIGFLEERQQLKLNSPNDQFAPLWLYFGCRFSDKDFIYKKELNEFVENGTLSKLKVAHSREENKGMKYVQDYMIADAEDIVKLITVDLAVIFVCGDLSTMGKQVKDCFVQCFKTIQGIDDTEANTILTDLKNNQRYVEDIWT